MKLDSLGGRRWLTSVGLILLAAGLLLHGRLDGEQWKELVIWVYGLFAGANVTQRGVEAAKDVKTVAQQSAPPQEPKD